MQFIEIERIVFHKIEIKDDTLKKIVKFIFGRNKIKDLIFNSILIIFPRD